jgi:hypothetical protein
MCDEYVCTWLAIKLEEYCTPALKKIIYEPLEMAPSTDNP